jgi:LysM repeat protein
MISTCDEFYLVVSGDDCATVAASAGISLDTFYAWNPAVGSSCADLELDEYVCIGIIGYTVTSTTATSTTSGDGISTPSPVQTGMISTCDEFYLVVSGDDCATVAASAGISLDTFYAWNPAVGSNCADLELDEYVCIDIIGYTPSTTTTSTSTTTSSGNGITTPTPYETGMVSDCDSFYLVTSGDTCTSIADSAGITVADIEAWNADVGTDCTDIWLDYYICVGIL